eukprot:TRINITY_DN16839_c0_g1_i1.p1 TRINITY_DN16839_c0_g1~~TRINITY_DN16839_c0_g1_i1.p1  ORF type:complete len:321 (-),score=33.39 TRINITY_DN16839_c0_g1_i1:202-1164(-)
MGCIFRRPQLELLPHAQEEEEEETPHSLRSRHEREDRMGLEALQHLEECGLPCLEKYSSIAAAFGKKVDSKGCIEEVYCHGCFRLIVSRKGELARQEVGMRHHERDWYQSNNVFYMCPKCKSQYTLCKHCFDTSNQRSRTQENLPGTAETAEIEDGHGHGHKAHDNKHGHGHKRHGHGHGHAHGHKAHRHEHKHGHDENGDTNRAEITGHKHGPGHEQQDEDRDSPLREHGHGPGHEHGHGHANGHDDGHNHGPHVIGKRHEKEQTDVTGGIHQRKHGHVEEQGRHRHGHGHGHKHEHEHAHGNNHRHVADAKVGDNLLE